MESQSINPMLVLVVKRAVSLLVATRSLDILHQVTVNSFDDKSFRVHKLFQFLLVSNAHNLQQKVQSNVMGLRLLHIEAWNYESSRS